MRKTLITALVGLGLAMIAGLGIAQADGDVSFGIRPTQASPDRPETFSYFSYSLKPGAVLSDEALVVNSGEVPVTLKLYAADGITAINGGTAFAQQGQESPGGSRGVGGWLSLPVAEIALEPGEQRVVPFTIHVPDGASPGHHVAGLVVEAPPTPGDGGQFSVSVIRQVGVAVVIEVPGAAVPGLTQGSRLEITGAGLRQQDDQGATFVIAVRNTGNQLVRAEGSLRITDAFGLALASIPFSMDTVLPGDATTFQITDPIHLADGDYLLTAVLEYAGAAALLEGIELTVKDGQPEGDPIDTVLSPPPITEIVPASTEDGGSGLDQDAPYGAPLVALVLAALALITFRVARKKFR